MKTPQTVEQSESLASDKAQLDSAITLLRSVKSNLMHQRCFGQDTLQGYRTTCTSAEGDIEQWLIDNDPLWPKPDED